jgi:predicted nucleic acid-binding protein
VVLVDTSVWIEFFRRPARIDLPAVVDLDDVVTCLPVFQEVLQGFRDEAAFTLARDAMLALAMVEAPLEQEVFEEAISLYRRARAAGFTVRSSVDCLIAACALRHGLTVLHHDRDFGILARVSPLRVREA